VIRLARSSIRKTLILVLLLTSSIALTLATLGFAVNDWFALRASAHDRLRAQAGIVASNSVAALTFGDRIAAGNTLESLQSQGEIIAAVLFAADGRVFAQYQRENERVPLVLPERSQGELGEHLFVVHPLVLEGETIGNILVVSELGFWQQRQRYHLRTALALFLLSLLVVYVISTKLQRIVSLPIIKLAKVARRVTESQDYSLRAEKLSRDEIGRLVDDFNEMLHQIQLRDRQLQGSRELLEEKVQERTAELTELTRQLEHQAYYDTLTGLANRSTFDDHLRLAIGQSQRHGGSVAVLFMDLDRFKVINDTLGHIVGDKLLIQVANRFSACLRGSDTLARLGGDEFAVLLVEPRTDNEATEVASKLIAAINQPFSVEGYSLHVTTSIGISVFPGDGDSAEAIIKNADTAMYRAKDSGRNQFAFFAAEMNARALRRLELENKMRSAIRDQGFRIFYQPRRDTHTLELIGVEALIRWFDPGEGEISPVEFIPLAEECGLTAKIDDWVMETACAEILSCFDGGEPEFSLSVNFSPSQFIRKDLDKVIADILQRTGFPGHCLELEITENLFGPESANAPELLKRIGGLGLEISIDDFGKAYSSLSRLKQLPLETLKIDRSFIQDLGRDQDDEILVRTIITMAHSLGLKVVAEGVETDAQYQFVKAYNCNAVQGFLFGRPMDLGQLKALLAEKNALLAANKAPGSSD